MDMDPKKWLQVKKTLGIDAIIGLLPQTNGSSTWRWAFAVACVSVSRVLDSEHVPGYGMAAIEKP
jgi:hypothetical protein